MAKMIKAAALAAALSLCAPAWALDPIDGTWKADLGSVVLDEKPSVYLLKDGVYSCQTCVPALTVKADGQFHAVADRPYYDSIAVRVVDDRTVTTVRKKGERVVSESTVQTEPDGKRLKFTFVDANNLNAPPVTGGGSEVLVTPGPAGSHAISGAWKTERYDSVSEAGLTVTFKLDGDTLYMSSPSGQSYAAKLGGPAVPIVGDTGGTLASVKRLNDGTIEETNLRDGKVVGVTTMTTAADGKSMVAVFENKLQGSKMTYKAFKQ